MVRYLLCLSLLAAPALADAANGTVTFLEGEATRAPRNGKPQRLSLDAEVAQGDTVETRADTRLEITMPDKSKVRLGPNSRLVLEKAEFREEGRDFKAKLFFGSVWSKVSKVFGAEKNFEIRTERAVAGVRGTIFRIDGPRSKAVMVRVYEGAVAVAGQRASDAKVQKGERIQVKGPQQVDRKQWEKIVTAMMQVKVSADGTPGEPERFDEAEDRKDAWARWNRERDEE